MKIPLLRDLNLSSEELKEIAKLLARKRGIKGYKNVPEDRLLSALILSKPVKKDEKPNFSKARTEKIERDFNKSRHKFSKSKIKEIRRNLYEIKSKKNLFGVRMKEVEKNLDELERKLFKTKKYYDYDDAGYKVKKNIKGLFDSSTDEDYYKPIIVNSAFSNNYKDKILTVNEYLDMIRPYLVDIINDHKIESEWKIQLTVAINFISSKPDSDETRIMHAKSDNIEIMTGSETDEVIEELFESLLQRYQRGLEESMRGSEFVFDDVNSLYYDLNKISSNRGKSYIESPERLKNKKEATNMKNNDSRCFQYA